MSDPFFAGSEYWDDFVYWITERESVRLKKEIQGERPPWTKDPIIQNTRFCNVHREDDKVTRWIDKNWRKPFGNHPHLAFSMCLARLVNWPDTLGALGFPEDWYSENFIEAMDKLSAGGTNKIWGGAYMVTGGYSKGGETKQVIIARVLDNAYDQAKKLKPGMHLDTAFDLLTETPGLGTFLAAQVIADLKYTPLLDGAPDWQTFCAPGPGSTMGLNILYDRKPYTKGLSDEAFSSQVNAIADYLADEYGICLTAHDCQNCLCEFSKYIRIKYLGGRAKTGYAGYLRA